jgi:DNA-binding GntR family transcriptional regulator
MDVLPAAPEPVCPDPAKGLVKLSRVAYLRFKEALFAGRIPTGAVVTQNDLITRLDVPIGPLREALQVLESEGLITMLPRAGIRVIKPDLSLIKNSFQLRRILELEALRKFAERTSIADIDEWVGRHEAVIAQAERGDAKPALIDSARNLDLAFHAALIGALRNPLIDEIYGRTKDQIRLIRLDRLYMWSTATVTQTMREHLRVLSELQQRHADAAVAAMETHLAAALHRAIGL